MILDIELYNSTSPNSAKRILCRCDTCGTERLVIKQNLVKAKTGDCAKCSSITIGHLHKGMVHDEEHRRKTSIASTGRVWSEDAKAKHRAKARRGNFNNKWNPDRDVVAKNEAVRRSAYSLLWGTLRRIGSDKLSSSKELLGYSAEDLAAHIEKQFMEGMSWKDRSEWHIDHIKPVSVFIKEGITDVRVINSLSNLRPMWAKENMSKQASWVAH